MQHLGAHSSVALILCQEIGPVQFRECPLSERAADERAIRLQGSDILHEEVLFTVGVVGSESGDHEIKLIFFCQPAIRVL